MGGKKIKVCKQTIYAFLLLMCLIIAYAYESTMVGSGVLHNIQFVSIIGTGILLYIIASWKTVYYRILSPYIIIVSTLYLTLCGQSVAWAFGLKAGYRDLRYAAYGTVTFLNNELCHALLYSYLCIVMLHVAVLAYVDPSTKKMKRVEKAFEKEKQNQLNSIDKRLYKILVVFGILLIALTIVPYLVTNLKSYSIMRIKGYGAQYDSVSYGLNSIGAKIADFFPVGVVTLLFAWGKKTEYNKNNYELKCTFAYLIVGLHLFIQLLLSQRTGVILFTVAILFLYFTDKKIPRKWILFGILGCAILMAGMRMVDMIRSGSVADISDFFTYVADDDNNPVLDFLGDIGWNLMTTLEFQKVIPSAHGFGLGSSYLVSMTSIIPNLNFWTVHPAYQYGNISGWLQEYLRFSFGIGCTPVAESYYNFGVFGFLFFLIWGKFIASLNRKFDSPKSILDNYQVILFMGILLKSSVRSSMFAVFRPYIFYVVLPVILIKTVYQNRTLKA